MAIWLLSKDGSKLAYDIGIGVNSTSFISRMFLLGLVFVLGFWFTLGLGCVGKCLLRLRMGHLRGVEFQDPF